MSVVLRRQRALRLWLLFPVLFLTGCFQARENGATTEYTLSPRFLTGFIVVLLVLSAGVFLISWFLWKEARADRQPDGEHFGAAISYFVVALVPLFFVVLTLVASGDRYAITAEGYEWRFAHTGGEVRFADVVRFEDVHHVHSRRESFRVHLRDGTCTRVPKPTAAAEEHLLRELARRGIPVEAVRDESWEDFVAFLWFAAPVILGVLASLGVIYGLGSWIARRRQRLRPQQDPR